MKRSLFLIYLSLLISINVSSQINEAQLRYEEFKKLARNDYETFRDEANRQYAEWMKEAWASFQVLPAIPKPKEEEVPPVVIDEKDQNFPIDDNPLPIDGIIPSPYPEPQPVPIGPIREQPRPQEKCIAFLFYGTNLQVRFNDEQRFKLNDINEKSLSDAWIKLSSTAFNNTIRDCLELRIRLNLNDWAYLLMLQKLSEACFGKGNEATMLMAFIFCQSGYMMRLGLSNNKLVMLFGTKHHIYDWAYYQSGDYCLYPIGIEAKDMQVCNTQFPNEKPLSLWIPKQPKLSYAMSQERILTSRRYSNLIVKSSVNKNLIDFYNDYPASESDDNFMTRWAMYANTPMAQEVTNSIYPILRQAIAGHNQLESADMLLNWVQTAFVYEYDEKVWGHDRALFAEESLYYPYCDCEDRSILFSHLVRDLLGLEVVLVYYPGHLATAVCFTDNVKGDYIPLGNKRFVICDPTYIGAPVGRTMPDMNNKNAKVILLGNE